MHISTSRHMRHVTIYTTDKDYDRFLELAKGLSYVKKIETDEEPTKELIPEAHKAIVRQRIKNSKADELLDWDTVKNDFDGI